MSEIQEVSPKTHAPKGRALTGCPGEIALPGCWPQELFLLVPHKGDTVMQPAATLAVSLQQTVLGYTQLYLCLLRMVSD